MRNEAFAFARVSPRSGTRVSPRSGISPGIRAGVRVPLAHVASPVCGASRHFKFPLAIH